MLRTLKAIGACVWTVKHKQCVIQSEFIRVAQAEAEAAINPTPAPRTLSV
jgi:hypothetical protein